MVAAGKFTSAAVLFQKVTMENQVLQHAVTQEEQQLVR
jgi:hypothetical protein